MLDDYQYKQGDQVLYNLSPLQQGVAINGEERVAKIVGVASIPTSFVGATYILEDKERFPNEDYPYSTFPMLELYLRKA